MILVNLISLEVRSTCTYRLLLLHPSSEIRFTDSQVYTADEEASESEGEDGDDDGSDHDLREQFDDIYDDMSENKGGADTDVDIEEQMAMTSSSEVLSCQSAAVDVDLL